MTVAIVLTAAAVSPAAAAALSRCTGPARSSKATRDLQVGPLKMASTKAACALCLLGLLPLAICFVPTLRQVYLRDEFKLLYRK
jgi:hypothetical protein